MRSFNTEFETLTTLAKFANKDNLLFIDGRFCFIIHKNIYENIIIKKIDGLSYGLPNGLYLYTDIKNMVDELKQFNKAEVVIDDEDNCIQIRNYNKVFIKPFSIHGTIYEPLILSHYNKINNLLILDPVLHLDNARTIPKFEEAINLKSVDGARIVWLNNNIGVTIFKNFLPINKSDIVDLSVYDMGENYITKYIINKKKYSIEIIASVLKLR